MTSPFMPHFALGYDALFDLLSLFKSHCLSIMEAHKGTAKT